MEGCNHESEDSLTITNHGSHVTIRFNGVTLDGEEIEDMILSKGESAVISLDTLEPKKTRKEVLDFNEHDFSDETRDALK